MASKPLSRSTQEVRLATTMTGGVSLAVWMAGVTREINLLSQASQRRRSAKPDTPESKDSDDSGRDRMAKESLECIELYEKLINLLDVVVDVDILSGTSAGGINAAFLALARVTGYDLAGLRDLWLDLGALLDLIRDPTDKDTPSLLYGDRRMFAVLAEQLRTLAHWSGRSASPPPTTLYITTTLLTGETSRFTDSFGTLVQDVDRRGVFTFTGDQLAQNNIGLALALAARSSASFPLAFEPSFVPFNQDVPATRDIPARPPMQDYANITRSHWVADGGLLDNQPIDVLLKRIFDSPATRAVRRVLLFVVPSSGPAPTAEAAPADDVNQPLGLVEGLLKDISAMTTQSIAADLRAIRAHQDRMAALTDSRLRLAEFAGRISDRLLTESVLRDYVTREATKQAEILGTALFRRLDTWPPKSTAAPDGVPTTWQAELSIGGDAEKACRRGITQLIVERWPTEPLPEDLDQLARYGEPAFELAKGTALAVVQTAYEVAASREDLAASNLAIENLSRLTAAIHAAYERPAPDLGELVDIVCRKPAIRSASLKAAAAELAAQFLDRTTVPTAAWQQLGWALLNWLDLLLDLSQDARPRSDRLSGSTDSLRERHYAAADQLKIYVDYFQREVDPRSFQRDAPPDSVERMATNLFDLAVTQRAMLPAEADVEQSLELVQVSADTRSLLAPDFQTAQQKLTGMQFHHFGAFYKRSWRANDWMWGRLDGAGWLVHVLLDPQRVRWIVQNHADEHDRDPKEAQPGAKWLIDTLRGIGAPAIPPRGFPLPPTPDGSERAITEKTLRTELRFLDDAGVPIPSSIPMTSQWLARTWQQKVLDQELNVLANAVIDPEPGKTPDWSPTASLSWARKVLATKGDAKYALLEDNPVAKETLSSDRSSPLMAHTITKAAATTSSAARGVQQLPAVLKPTMITVQTLALAGYRVVSLTKGVARWTIEIGAALLVLGVAGAMQNVTLLGIGGLIFAWTGGYLIVLGTWQSSSKPGVLRQPKKEPTGVRNCLRSIKTRWQNSKARRSLSASRTKIRVRASNSKIWLWLSRPLVPLLSVTLVGAVLTMAAPCARKWLFGKDQHDSGVVGGHVYWLGQQWWHPLIAVGVIALSITLVGIAVRPRRK
jgi:patatin-related protein